METQRKIDLFEKEEQFSSHASMQAAPQVRLEASLIKKERVSTSASLYRREGKRQNTVREPEGELDSEPDSEPLG